MLKKTCPQNMRALSCFKEPVSEEETVEAVGQQCSASFLLFSRRLMNV